MCLHAILLLYLQPAWRGCDFQYDGAQIDMGNSLKKAVIVGNIFTVSPFIPQTGMEPAIYIPCHLTPLFLLSLKHSS